MQILTPAKLKNIRQFHGAVLLAACLVMALAGCASDKNQKEVYDPPGPSESVLPKLVVGDTITVTLSGIPEPPLPFEKPISDDGTISLPDIGRVPAAGKTAGELEDVIHGRYVPNVYTHLTVTVKITGDRVYFVRGEVKQPNRLIYVGPTTLTKAIASAGDFTDFANHKSVWLIRANGKRFRLNCDKILAGEVQDPLVYPGDQIVVERRIL